MYKNCMKRLLDLIGSIILLPVVCLVVIVFAPFIYFEDRGSIFYLAKRRGLNGKIFNMFKLRSMSMNAPDIRNKDNSTYNAPDDPRVTRIGRLMRKTSVDELPQVFNIIKGDMSFIGPRPITTDKPMSEYDEKRRIRLTVRPGITGYSQAYYRNAISQEEKLQNDAWYAQHVSFPLDVKIFFKTIQTVLLRKNVYKS
ncbi:MAG: sugar transferase [Lachnospiraceae bacterium]|nr:sugar transferase [Lachnospiraceae bacterium]